MIFVKKQKENISMKLVDELVRAYFDCLESNNLELTYSEVSELLRYSMCKLLNLQSKGYSKCIEDMSTFIDLSSILVKYDVNSQSDDYKKGLLEACVHCMEMSRKRI